MIFPPFVSSLEDVYSVDTASGNPSSSDAPGISEQVMAAGFPQTMHLTWTQSTSTMALFLSDESSQTLYAALMPRGWQGPTYLFPGSTFIGDAICSSNGSGNDFVFQLPGVPSYQIPSDEITMSYHRSRSNPRFSFSMKVESEEGRKTEAFEWRVSGGAQNSAYSMVWELVSLGRTNKSSSHRPRSSDVVAMVHEESMPGMSSSMQIVGGFQFLGRSMTTYMGYHWTVVAVMSGISVLKHASRE
ncbi:Ff.00g022180.m01.CDS01 [Fusarium sp. VM40]|nr:Ff.00g022180.m01.CDS01 [Fusarium sp. VM40]